jgi:hypothetical protein
MQKYTKLAHEHAFLGADNASTPDMALLLAWPRAAALIPPPRKPLDSYYRPPFDGPVCWISLADTIYIGWDRYYLQERFN